MPAIPQYTQRVSAQGPLGPGPTGDKGIQAIGVGLEDVQQAHERAQQADGAVWASEQLSKAQSEWTQQIEQRKLDAAPGAPNFTPQVLSDYDQYSGKLLGGAPDETSRRFLEERLLAYRNDLQQHAMGFEAQARVANKTQSVKDSVEAAANELYTSPSVFTQRVAERSALIDGMGLDPLTRQKLQEYATGELAKYAVVGRVNQNPKAALLQLQSPTPADPAMKALTPEERLSMVTYAHQALTAQYVDEERSMRLAKEAKELAQQKTQNDFLNRMDTANGSGQLTAQDVLHSNLQAFGSGSKDEFLNMLRAGTNKSDPATFNELFTRIHVPDGTPGKLVDANDLNAYVTQRSLSVEDLNRLRAEIEQKGTAQGDSETALKRGVIDIAKQSLTRSNPLLGIQDPQGEENLQRFTSWFLDAYQRERQGGKSPRELLDPQSPDYLGKRIAAYVKSPTEILKDTLASANAPKTDAPARKPDESPADYLKRIGKQ